jgi:hypothetical protein
MKKVLRSLLLCFILVISSSYSFQHIDYRTGMYKNVCKNLRNDVLLYFIFVDNKSTAPWTEFDIRSTIDSVAIARRWLMEQAKKYHIPLTVKTDYYIGSDFTTISKNLPGGSVYQSAITPNFKNGLKELNKWADWIARKAGTNFNLPQKDGIPDIKNPRNKERLIAYLRDEYHVESVALLFMVNNYFKTDISLQINTMNTDDIEFAIVSYKYPGEIAHNFLHLYGAADMHKTLYRRNEKKIKQLFEMVPNEIMQDTYAKNINNLEISEYTRYLIGWQDAIDPKWNEFFTDKFVNF